MNRILSLVYDILILTHCTKNGGSSPLTSQKLLLIPQARLQMFSDLIFGLSLSISAITLIGSPAYSQPSIINKIISFIFNFTVLIMIWIRYTGTTAILPIATGQHSFLNLLM